MAHKKQAESVTFNGRNKYNVVELFKGSGPFEARFPDEDTVVIYPSNGPELIVKVGDTVLKNPGGDFFVVQRKKR